MVHNLRQINRPGCVYLKSARTNRQGIKARFWRLLVRFRSFVWLSLLLLLNACSLKVYGPNYQFVPAHQALGDVDMQGGVGAADEVQFVDFSFAAGLNNNWGVLFKGSLASERNKSNNTNSSSARYTGNSQLGELGLAYNWWWNEKSFFQLQSGLGIGRQFHNPANGSSRNIDWHRIYIQPAYMHTNGFVDVTFSIRACMIGFDRNLIALRLENEYSNDPDKLLSNASRQLYSIEPAVSLGIGYKSVRWYLQTSLAYYSKDFPAEQIYIGTGLQLRLRSR